MDLLLPDIVDGEDKSSSLKNRIRNNYRHLKKWARRECTNCFRIYDREIPYYPLAIDFYAGRFCVHYFSKIKGIIEPPESLVAEVHEALYSLFAVPLEHIYWRTRIRRKKIEQYEKVGESSEFFTILEYGVKFRVNLQDYLDTGLFLDHRETRKLVASASEGKRLLNLFAYTCSFSVHAAIKGALFTKSVDMSNTYTEWGKENFLLNGLSLKNNQVVRSDCLKFVDEEAHLQAKYDVIIIDPPTLSRSKKMEEMFDLQVDYVPLLLKALKLLANGGVLFFSTNSRRFNFEESHFPGYTIKDISYKTLPKDFQDPKIHRCWTLIKAF
ncbi:MAG: class I SAM-dependent methyltransferase [Chlamydiales bacterium]|nr:class I SAM-dependent methyltransferase [Chlamydiales bacterium]